MFRQLCWFWKEWAQTGRNALQNSKLRSTARQSDSIVELARNWASKLGFWLWVWCWPSPFSVFVATSNTINDVCRIAARQTTAPTAARVFGVTTQLAQPLAAG